MHPNNCDVCVHRTFCWYYRNSGKVIAGLWDALKDFAGTRYSPSDDLHDSHSKHGLYGTSDEERKAYHRDQPINAAARVFYEKLATDCKHYREERLGVGPPPRRLDGREGE